MPLKRASKKVVFVNTAPKEKRVGLLKSKQALEQMEDDSENVFCTSPVDRYSSRPDVLEHMCMAEFAATYTTHETVQTDEDDHMPQDLLYIEEEANQSDRILRYPKSIELKNHLGLMTRRNQYCVIRFHKEKEGEEMYRNLLMLYLPWRDEDQDLMAGFQSYEDHFEHVEETVASNERLFSVKPRAFDLAQQQLEEEGAPEYAWDAIAPNAQEMQAVQEEEGAIVDRHLPAEENQHNPDLQGNDPARTHSELHHRFSAHLANPLMDHQQYRSMMRSLNDKQWEFMQFHRKWCKDMIASLKRGEDGKQNLIFLSGPGGVGKSHIIKLVHYETVRLMKPLSGYFDLEDVIVLLTAFTGTAAFGIESMTIHSALSFACGPRGSKEYRSASSDSLNTLKSRLGNLKLLIIDEVSMVGADLLLHIHRRLTEILDPSEEKLFGGLSILAVGDLYQLQPVGQNHVFAVSASDYMARLYGSLWARNFKMMELTECMRQRDDQEFAQLLMRLRTASCTEDDIQLLLSRVVSKSDENYPSDALHVFKTNKDVDTHNDQPHQLTNCPVSFPSKS